MFGVKTFISQKILYPRFLFPADDSSFPEKASAGIRIKARLFGTLSRLKKQKKYPRMSDLTTCPHKASVVVWKKLLPYNPNNLGNWSILTIKPSRETAAIERELIWKMIDLYRESKEKLEGYVTSGGTESNIFSAWVGRNFLEKKGIKRGRICLIKSSLTHYSVEKAADIIGVPTVITPLNRRSWGMDVAGLRKTIEELYKRSYKGFLVPLTLGYTLTGTVDPYEEVCKVVRNLKKKLGVEFFIWIDAALNGLIEPFLNEKFSPFFFPEVQAFLTDFHKFGFVPIPAGVILYRKELRELIEKPVDYLGQKDNTMLGSRSGIAPVACWVMIHSLGKRGFKALIKKRREKRKEFLGKHRSKRGLNFVVSPRSLSCGIIIKERGLDFKEYSRKYGLDFRRVIVKFADGSEEVLISKAFFLDGKK